MLDRRVSEDAIRRGAHAGPRAFGVGVVALVLMGLSACSGQGADRLAHAGPNAAPSGSPPPSYVTTTASASSPVSPPATPGPIEESSPGISREEARSIVPLAPTHLDVTKGPASVTLTWSRTGEDVAYFLCLRKVGPGGVWQEISRIPGASPEPYTCVDGRVQKQVTYFYGVQALNVYGTASSITTSGAVTIH